MAYPLVSVILATYNGSGYLTEVIESVLSQSYPHLELIIIDDASTDKNVTTIIHDYASRDERVRTFRNEKNMERSWSKNFGVSQSKGEYIAFIDDDDTWQQEKLREQVELFHDASIGIVGTFAEFIDELGRTLGVTSHLSIVSAEIEQHILLTNQFIHSSVLMRKNIFESVGGFPLEMHLCEDYDLWLRVLRKTSGRNIALPLVRYRVRASSTTAKNIYRMKWATIRLIWQYRRDFPYAFRALFLKCVTFLFPTSVLVSLFSQFGRKYD